MPTSDTNHLGERHRDDFPFREVRSCTDKGKGAEQDERVDALGVAGREQHREGAALREPQDRRTLGTSRIEDSAEIVHPLFKRRFAHVPV